MRVLALDLSKSSTGFALWAPGERVVSGYWNLGSEYTSRGRVYGRLHEEMSALTSLGDIEALFFEEPIHPAQLQGGTNVETIKLAAGLAAHAESFAEAMGVRIVREVNNTTWRRHFIGKMKRGTRTSDLKQFAMQRCREYGFNPQRHDQAEAIGILDYACEALGILPPWRSAVPLVRELA